MPIVESIVIQCSSVPENENDTRCLDKNSIDHKLNRRLQLGEPIEVDGCAHKKVHQFYFIKCWPYEDQTLKSRIQEAEKLYKRINLEAWSTADKYTERLADQENAATELRCLCSRNTEYTLSWTLNKLEQLQEALHKLNSARNVHQRRAIKSCSSRELVNYRPLNMASELALQMMLHRPNNFTTEKQLLREINKSLRPGAVESFSPVAEFRVLFQGLQNEMQRGNYNEERKKQILNNIQQLQQTWDKAIAKAIQKGNIWNPLGTEKAILAQIRHTTKISEELRKEHVEVKDKMKRLMKDLDIAEKDIRNFRKEFDDVKQRRYELHRHILDMRRQLDEAKGRYCRYASILNKARDLARKENIQALQELSQRVVDLFMSQWKKRKAFRYNYVRSILPSLDSRQLSRDGRMRQFNEQLLYF